MSGARPPRVRDIAEALALRGWALALLHPATRASAGEPPVASPDAWRLFLAAERCAAPLVAARRAPVAGSGGAVLAAEATAEAQRALSARLAAAEIGAAARAAGLRLVLLKGAVDVVESGTALYLTDLDLLVEPDDFARARALLGSLGYAADSDADPAALSTCNVNLAPPPGGVQLELHWTTRRDLAPLPAATWDSLVPLRRAPGLFSLQPTTHAWHVLTHGVLDHPEQQGRLRDALVLGRALAGGDDVLATLGARAAGHEFAEALQRALALADSLRRGSAPPPDTFLREVSLAYALHGAMAGPLPRPLLREAAVSALLGAGAGAPGRRTWRESMRLHDVEGTTAARALRPLPRGARTAAGRAARIAHYALHLAPAAPTLARAAAARLWRAAADRRRAAAAARDASLTPPRHHA